MTGSGVQVLQVTEDHSYELNLDKLNSILMRQDVKELPAVVVSLAGVHRGGKSFMLNFFLRYLNAPVSARLDGSWVGTDSEPLDGFSWCSGSQSNTKGILLWSEPFLASLPSGEKVAVLLMDTQGTFDGKSTVRDVSTIFALSTLLSCVQVYNLPGGAIHEDDLQRLQMFTEYGKLVNERSDDGEKPFQGLEFLVRDWGNDFEYPYGGAGGQAYLDRMLQTGEDMPKESSELRRHMRASFQTVSCSLMPHPGLKVTRPNFKGNLSEIEPEFVAALKELTSSLFGQKLKVKMINGHVVKTSDLLVYMRSYTSILNSNTIPTPTSIMKATAEAGLLVAMITCREQYETKMDTLCADNAPSLPADDLMAIHSREVIAARTTFITTKKMGPKEDADKMLAKLTQDLEKRLPLYVSVNLRKTQKAIIEAKEAYEKKIQDISGKNVFCVHAEDLVQVHNEAAGAAIKLFDTNRKSNSKDDERTVFISSFAQRLTSLRISNEQNNNMAVSDLVGEYNQKMLSKISSNHPLSSSEFEQKHQQTLVKALHGFKKKRNRPNSFSEDVFITRLTEKIESTHQRLKVMNNIKNNEALVRATDAYSKYMAGGSAGKEKHLTVEALHHNGKCRALEVLRPKHNCIVGVDISDAHEKALLEALELRFIGIQERNNLVSDNKASGDSASSSEDIASNSTTDSADDDSSDDDASDSSLGTKFINTLITNITSNFLPTV